MAKVCGGAKARARASGMAIGVVLGLGHGAVIRVKDRAMANGRTRGYG